MCGSCVFYKSIGMFFEILKIRWPCMIDTWQLHHKFIEKNKQTSTVVLNSVCFSTCMWKHKLWKTKKQLAVVRYFIGKWTFDTNCVIWFNPLTATPGPCVHTEAERQMCVHITCTHTFKRKKSRAGAQLSEFLLSIHKDSPRSRCSSTV